MQIQYLVRQFVWIRSCSKSYHCTRGEIEAALCKFVVISAYWLDGGCRPVAENLEHFPGAKLWVKFGLAGSTLRRAWSVWKNVHRFSRLPILAWLTYEMSRRDPLNGVVVAISQLNSENQFLCSGAKGCLGIHHYYISTKNPTAVMPYFRHFPVACTTLWFFLSVGNLSSVSRHLSNRRLSDT